MSAANRGAIRNEADFYATPEWAVERFLENFNLAHYDTILEPCAGNGAIVKTLRKHRINAHIIAAEIRDSERNNLYAAGAQEVIIDDFLGVDPSSDFVELIITNPPYSKAQEIIEHCFEIAGPETDIVMLLRLNFLGSQKRKAFWDKHPPTQIYVLSQRPSFTGRGTDATEYAWFVWSSWHSRVVKVI